jgi:hypothetical protein
MAWRDPLIGCLQNFNLNEQDSPYKRACSTFSVGMLRRANSRELSRKWNAKAEINLNQAFNGQSRLQAASVAF